MFSLCRPIWLVKMSTKPPPFKRDEHYTCMGFNLYCREWAAPTDIYIQSTRTFTQQLVVHRCSLCIKFRYLHHAAEWVCGPTGILQATWHHEGRENHSSVPCIADSEVRWVSLQYKCIDNNVLNLSYSWLEQTFLKKLISWTKHLPQTNVAQLGGYGINYTSGTAVCSDMARWYDCNSHIVIAHGHGHV